MLVRVVCADVPPGARQMYVDLCINDTIPRLVNDQIYLGHKICDSLATRTDTAVFATVWKDDKTLRAFVAKQAPGVTWTPTMIFPWEAGAVVSAEIHHVEDVDYSGLVFLWTILSVIVRQRSVPSPSPLADAQWLLIQPALSHQQRLGRRRNDNRPLFEAVLDVILRGTDWNKGRLTPGATVPTIWRRYKEWVDDGKWQSAWREYLDTLEAQERVILALNFLDCSHPPPRRR